MIIKYSMEYNIPGQTTKYWKNDNEKDANCVRKMKYYGNAWKIKCIATQQLSVLALTTACYVQIQGRCGRRWLLHIFHRWWLIVYFF